MCLEAAVTHTYHPNGLVAERCEWLQQPGLRSLGRAFSRGAFQGSGIAVHDLVIENPLHRLPVGTEVSVHLPYSVIAIGNSVAEPSRDDEAKWLRVSCGTWGYGLGVPDDQPCNFEVFAGVRIRHGEFDGWYSDGTRAICGHFKDGKRTGDWVFWHPNGLVHARGGFLEGHPAGTWEYWYPSGQKWAVWRAIKGTAGGDWTVWTPDGELETLSGVTVQHHMRRVIFNCETIRFSTALSNLNDLERQIEKLPDSARRRTAMTEIERLRATIQALADERLASPTRNGPSDDRRTFREKYPAAKALEDIIRAVEPAHPPTPFTVMAPTPNTGTLTQPYGASPPRDPNSPP